MRVAGFGYLRLAFTIGVALALATPGAAPAATQGTAPAPQSFKVMISPEYATAGQPTTFEVTIVNTSTEAATLGSVKLTPPSGFTPPQPAPGTPLRRKTKVHNRTLSVNRLSLQPGDQAQLSVTATAPTKCGRTVLHWTAQGFQGATGSGTQLALRVGAQHAGRDRPLPGRRGMRRWRSTLLDESRHVEQHLRGGVRCPVRHVAPDRQRRWTAALRLLPLPGPELVRLGRGTASLGSTDSGAGLDRGHRHLQDQERHGEGHRLLPRRRIRVQDRIGRTGAGGHAPDRQVRVHRAAPQVLQVKAAVHRQRPADAATPPPSRASTRS